MGRAGEQAAARLGGSRGAAPAPTLSARPLTPPARAHSAPQPQERRRARGQRGSVPAGVRRRGGTTWAPCLGLGLRYGEEQGRPPGGRSFPLSTGSSTGRERSSPRPAPWVSPASPTIFPVHAPGTARPVPQSPQSRGGVLRGGAATQPLLPGRPGAPPRPEAPASRASPSRRVLRAWVSARPARPPQPDCADPERRGDRAGGASPEPRPGPDGTWRDAGAGRARGREHAEPRDGARARLGQAEPRRSRPSPSSAAFRRTLGGTAAGRRWWGSVRDTERTWVARVRAGSASAGAQDLPRGAAGSALGPPGPCP